MKWFKFYGQDWLTDLKIRKMSVEDRLCFITLLALASSAGENGLIRNCDEESVIELTNLYNDPYNTDNEYNRAKGCLERYAALQIVTQARNGDVTVVNFNRRQQENLSNAERQKRYRNKRKNTIKNSNNSNVTQRNDSNARIDKNREEYIILSLEKDREVLSLVMDFWNSCGVAPRNVRNTSATKKLLPKCRKETDDIRLAIARILKKGCTAEDITLAIKAYTNEIVNRDPSKGTYHLHRFSLYDFLKQSNGFTKYYNS